MGSIAAEELVTFHRGIKGTDDGASGRVSFRDIHGEGAMETVILEVGLILVAPFALEGTVLAAVPGPGTDVDLAMVEEDCIGAGLRENDALAFLFQFLFTLLVTGFLEPLREVTARQFKTETYRSSIEGTERCDVL